LRPFSGRRASSASANGKPCLSIEFWINNDDGEFMNPEQTRVVQECARGALSGESTFPEIVGKLAKIGVERYHADYSRQEITYYLPDGDSAVIAMPHPSHPAANEFSATAVEAAVRQSQRNEHTYLDFIRKTMSAGRVGYFVQITGRRVIYFGRKGESHVEHFPPAPANMPTT
jgi:uncharacterized protein YbcV (DUF1398 family)